MGKKGMSEKGPERVLMRLQPVIPHQNRYVQLALKKVSKKQPLYYILRDKSRNFTGFIS